MIVSVLICIAVAVYCFMHGMVLAGVLSLAGVIPGPGLIPLMASSVLLFINGHVITALFPIFVIVYNVWVLFILQR